MRVDSFVPVVRDSWKFEERLTRSFRKHVRPRPREENSARKNLTGARKFGFLASETTSAHILAAALFVLVVCTLPAAARERDKTPYGEGLIVNIPLPESEVEQVVADIAANGIIRGTKEYNKDEFVEGAVASGVARVFPPWTQGGKVFYKVRDHALDPRNFKDGGDVGTLAVRYVLQPQGEKNTVLRIDALFQEEFRHTIHQSNGSVESSEYKDIQEHLEAIEVMKQQTVEAQEERREIQQKKKNSELMGGAFPSDTSVSPPPTQAAQNPPSAPDSAAVRSDVPAPLVEPAPQNAPPAQAPAGQTIEEHIKDLRKQVERVVKAPGAPLKSAPFHTASTLQSLASGTEVLIVISTPYWYGIETHEGQHGWVMRDQLEQP